MSIADKLTAIADNVQKVYEAGKVAGGGDGYYDTFWDVYQDNGKRTDYNYAFYSKYWKSGILKPKYDIKPTSATSMFSLQQQRYDLAATMDAAGVSLDFSDCTNLSNTFYGSWFTRIGVVSCVSVPQLSYTFNGVNYCETIDEVILKDDGSQTFPNTFLHAKALKNIKFSGVIGTNIRFEQSSLLSAESVQSIIDALKDLTGATVQTLTLHATVGAALTDEQKAMISAKNWTLAY